MQYLNFMAMRRSGHHAILFWMLEQMQTEQIWLMIDARPKEMNLGWLYNRAGGAAIFKKNPDALTIFNIEDRFDDNLPDNPTIVVMRSIQNNVASRVKAKGMKNPVSALFGRPTDAFYDTYRRMGAAVLANDVDLFIYYDKWFADPGYRKRVTAKLNKLTPVEFTDKGLNAVNKVIPGSSFDAHKFDTKAQEMAVLTRFEQVEVPPIPTDVLELSRLVEEKANET